MTCPHCGFLMSPLDADCARCRHRGYVPPTPPVSSTPNTPHPIPAYSYSPLPPVAPHTQPASRALEVMACLMGVAAMVGLVLFGLILHERRNARQQAEISALRQQLVEAQQAQTYTQARTQTPQIINVEVRSPVYPVYVPTPNVYPVYDPFAGHRSLHQEFMNQQLDAMRQHTEEMHFRHEANIERMHSDMQQMRDRMESLRQPRIHDPHDPFNPFGRF